jgi:phosphoribosylamine--glycine ligase / phosphoribosylformylglycinamidine cyclo-ligase
MNVLILGSGGREHALAWKLAQSPHPIHLFCLPGNAGTSQVGTNLSGQADDVKYVVDIARTQKIDLVLVGPETPLAAGVADALGEAGIPVFGPIAAAAQIESSKAFAKSFMQRHKLPTAHSEVFDNFESAIAYMNPSSMRGSAISPTSIVIKASGLASGKGVFLPETNEDVYETLHALLVQGSLGGAGREILIEERLRGREVSVLAFTDGYTILPMPPVQDHKRLLDEDQGPNTGGMGAYAPSPACPPEMLQIVIDTILQPTVAGLRSQGIPFIGVLYAGLMLTESGPKLLEFNCRFGDPETQVIIPLLASDLLEILLACTKGHLNEIAPLVRWHPGAAACIVAAAPGYPANPITGQQISYSENKFEPGKTWLFHAGTALKDHQLVTSGGRVLGITAIGDTLENAIINAYSAAAWVSFPGIHYRKDIGRAARASEQSTAKQSAYTAVGVSIDDADRAKALMHSSIRSTFTAQVLSDVGAFGGLFDAGSLAKMDAPVLVASTDGVGTKSILAAQAGRLKSLGYDIVNHCVNDILVQGARPLFFLDYIACAHLDPNVVVALVEGISEACCMAGCALLGGETAEMPGVYLEGQFDLAGTIVGLVERQAILPRHDIQPGDVLLGLASSGPHTNGYSLIRSIFKDTSLDTVFPALEKPLADILLAPHRSYLPILSDFLFKGEKSLIKGLAHLTGGGFAGNIPRILPAGCGARIEKNSWSVQPIFTLMQNLGQVELAEMYRVFNMGIGMVIVVESQNAGRVQQSLPELSWIIGEVIPGGGVQLV